MVKLTNVFDLCSAFVCLILFCYLFFDLGWKDKLNQRFLMMCAFNILMIAGTLLRRNCQGLAKPWYPFALHCGTGMIFIFAVPLILAFAGYVTQYLSPRVAVNRNFWRLCVILAVAQLVLSLLSVGMRLFYYIDENNFYHRGALYWISQPIPIILHLMQVGLIFGYRKYLRSMDVAYLLSYVVFPLTAEIAQMVNSEISFLGTGFTVPLLLLFLNIQFDWDFFMVGQHKIGGLRRAKNKKST